VVDQISLYRQPRGLVCLATDANSICSVAINAALLVVISEPAGKISGLPDVDYVMVQPSARILDGFRENIHASDRIERGVQSINVERIFLPDLPTNSIVGVVVVLMFTCEPSSSGPEPRLSFICDRL
jgi:hypothetical protein